MILITGGSGLLGSCLIKTIIKTGQKVRAIYRYKIPFEANNPTIEWVEADILDIVALESNFKGITHVYHCAAMVSFLPKDKDILYKINRDGTANIVNVCVENKVQKLVHVSSVAAILKLDKDTPINENIVWKKDPKKSSYGESKYLAEMEVWRGIAEGLNAVIINPSIILGFGNWQNSSAQIFKQVYNQFPWYTNAINGFVDVQDVVDIALLLMKSDIFNERFIVSAVNESYKNIFDLIAQHFNKKPPRYIVTKLLAAIVWRFEFIKYIITKKAPLVTKETVQSALTNSYYDNNKLLTFLPNFRYRNIADSIKRICGEYERGM